MAKQKFHQKWRAGMVTGTRGVFFDVRFPDGSTKRYHGNQMFANLAHAPDGTNGSEPVSSEALKDVDAPALEATVSDPSEPENNGNDGKQTEGPGTLQDTPPGLSLMDELDG